jgi:hypothetical protein
MARVDKIEAKIFGYERDLHARRDGSHFWRAHCFSEEREGQWVAVIEMEKGEILNAQRSRDPKLPNQCPSGVACRIHNQL